MKLNFTSFTWMLIFALGLLTQNSWAQKVCLVGSPADMSGLSADEAAAYQWAMDAYQSDAVYQSFADVQANGLPADCEVVWYHLQSNSDIPTDAADAASVVEAHLNAGGGVFLSGFGTKYIVNINATGVGPTETISNPSATSDAAWGFRPTPGQENHPFFNGLSTSEWPNPDWGGFRTVAEGTQTQETIAWWTGGAFPGTQLASLPWLPAGEPLTTLGILDAGSGSVAVASAPGYAWGAQNPMEGEARDNLELLTGNIISQLSTSGVSPVAAKVLLVGSAENLAGLSADEQNAYGWALSYFGANARYTSFNNLVADGLVDENKVIWYHLQATPDVPADATDAGTVLSDFLAAGNGLFLSGFGTKLITSTGATTVGPNETINNTNATADGVWGFRPTPGQEGHPFFTGLTESSFANPDHGGFRTVEEGTQAQETIAWWTGGSFPGTQLASLPWLPAGEPLATLGVLSGANGGTVAVATAPGFAWGSQNPMAGEARDNLERMTANILEALEPSGVEIALMGSAADMSGLSADEQAAYQFAMNEFGSAAQYFSFDEVAANGLPVTTEVIWYHLQDTTVVPMDAMNVGPAIGSFVQNGGGVFLSGFGTQLITSTGATEIGPNEVINNPNATSDAAWGFRITPGQESHPAFAGLPESSWPNPDWGGFRTIAEGSETNETMAWWTGGSYPGIQLASLPWLPAGEPLATAGELAFGDGAIIHAAAPGFAWEIRNGENGPEEQANLALFTSNIINYLYEPAPAPRILVTEGDDNVIMEGMEDGVMINVAVENATFVDPLDQGAWEVLNLPPAVTVGSITRADANNATIMLAGNADDYDEDITDFTVRVPGTQFNELGGSASLESVGEVVFDATVEIEATDLKVALLGSEEDMMNLDEDEVAAYAWALETFGENAQYFWVQDIVLNPESLDEFDVAWWHYEEFVDLPLLFDNPNTEGVLRNFRESGKGVFLSGTATQYVVNLGMTEKGPNQVEIAADPFENPDQWGFLSPVPDHPAFENLPNPFFGLSTTGLREDVRGWWNTVPDFDPDTPPADRFDGILLTATEWDANFQFIISTAEFQGDEGTGNVIACGAGAYDWAPIGAENTLIDNLELFTFNILNYLGDMANDIEEVPAQSFPVTAYPNPFTDEVGIYFTVDNDITLRVDILDLQGRLITTLEEGSKVQVGTYQYNWNAEGFNNGFYVYKVTAGDQVAFGKIVLQR